MNKLTPRQRAKIVELLKQGLPVTAVKYVREVSDYSLRIVEARDIVFAIAAAASLHLKPLSQTRH